MSRLKYECGKLEISGREILSMRPTAQSAHSIGPPSRADGGTFFRYLL